MMMKFRNNRLSGNKSLLAGSVMVNELGFNLKDANSPMMEQLLYFHDWVMFLLLGVMAITMGMLLNLFMFSKHSNIMFKDNQKIEFMWTIMPGIILVLIGIPSLRILYMMDEVGEPNITLKAIGHQWYWSYEYSDIKDKEFDSYMVKDNIPRLLSTDHHVVLPHTLPMRMIVTAADVLHSWTLPTAGIKADCVPGRLNQLMMLFDRTGLYYGQCSEICGSNHSFMPISMEVVTTNKFLEWL